MRDQAILRRITDRKAIILAEGGVKQDKSVGALKGQTFAAYPYGDRRRRPVSWIDRETLTRLLADGVIVKTAKGYEIVSSASVRAQADPGSGQGHARQHREMEPVRLAATDGIFRPALVNRNSKSVLHRLASQMDPNGKPFLSGAEIEAGERLSADYAKSAAAPSMTQNYSSAGQAVKGGTCGLEDLSIRAIDARRRVYDALAYVGPGLSAAISSVCCKDMGIEEMELTEGWVKRSGRTVLKIGLGRLAEFYGTYTGEAAKRSKPSS